MGVFSDTVTVYNAHTDPKTRAQTLYRTVLTGVSWHRTCETAVAADGLKSANVIHINVPERADAQGKQYLPWRVWGALSEDGKAGAWTLREGDLIVRGACELDSPRAADLRTQTDAYTLYAYNDSLKGTRRVRHYELEAK